MGNISPKEAFAASMAEAQRRANIASTLGLSLQERVQILKVWILPVVLLTARAYYPDPVVISSLTTVFNTTLGFDSWGITIQQMAKMKTEGGHELASPYVWLMTQAGSAFSSYVSFPSIFTTPLRLEFDLWARKYGVDCQQASLSYLSLGPVPTKTMGFLAHSLKAFSKARQHVLDGPRKNAVLLDMPLWHNSVFTNSKSNTYYCPSLIRTGVTRVKHVQGPGGPGGTKVSRVSKLSLLVGSRSTTTHSLPPPLTRAPHPSLSSSLLSPLSLSPPLFFTPHVGPQWVIWLEYQGSTECKYKYEHGEEY